MKRYRYYKDFLKCLIVKIYISNQFNNNYNIDSLIIINK